MVWASRPGLKDPGSKTRAQRPGCQLGTKLATKLATKLGTELGKSWAKSWAQIGRGLHSIEESILAYHPTAPGLNLSNPKKFSDEILTLVRSINGSA